ncbi:hypothetical protein [uncultured Bacteroides sp.]|uniref:hypothetical protein n=1 Tax=uncultured Bacteroides sp. TaxID=162156 RepID=UPI0026065D37|nr:hypothetical protein [uncultured Bacteroides sp.]
MKQRRIILPYGQRKKLVQRFSVSTGCVNDALRYHTNSPLSQTIREAAINECHGLVIEQDKPINR